MERDGYGLAGPDVTVPATGPASSGAPGPAGSRSTGSLANPASFLEKRVRATGARAYMRPLQRRIVATDVLVVTLAVALAHILRFGSTPGALGSIGRFLDSLDYTVVGALLVAAWVGMLRLHGAYDLRFAGHGAEEYRQVFIASAWLFGSLAVVSYVFKLEIARGYVALAFPIGTVLLLVGRWCWRLWLVKRRNRGDMSDTVLVVGDRDHVATLVHTLRRTPEAGYQVVGACINDVSDATVADVPVLGREDDAAEIAAAAQVNVVACTSFTQMGPLGLRRLSWDLEGKDVDLVVAPGLTDVAGPRVLTRPVQGLPLLHIEAPRFSGPVLAAKTAVDVACSVLGLLVLAPLLLLVAALIKLDSPGPVFFRQRRVGRDGHEFTMWKFRTMIPDAEARLVDLLRENDAAGPLFKLREDPRVTRVGRFLRRFSLDELPQLVNVLVGDMSLVGPRPPLAREVELYGDDMRRRLLVKPGMTGLWQVSGRSDLAWDDAVRFDLYYVENWSMVLDAQIVWRTFRVVVASHGAY